MKLLKSTRDKFISVRDLCVDVRLGSTHSVIPISFMDQIVEYESGISLHPIVRKPEPKKQLPPVVLESQSRVGFFLTVIETTELFW